MPTTVPLDQLCIPHCMLRWALCPPLDPQEALCPPLCPQVGSVSTTALTLEVGDRCELGVGQGDPGHWRVGWKVGEEAGVRVDRSPEPQGPGHTLCHGLVHLGVAGPVGWGALCAMCFSGASTDVGWPRAPESGGGGRDLTLGQRFPSAGKWRQCGSSYV